MAIVKLYIHPNDIEEFRTHCPYSFTKNASSNTPTQSEIVCGGVYKSNDTTFYPLYVSFGYGESGFSFYKMTIKPEYAAVIDSFFDQFGYKTSRVAIPNIHKRSNWDYIKTTSVNLEGPIPEDDMIKIKGLFDNGCTFWHTTTYFLDYTQTNSIL